MKKIIFGISLFVASTFASIGGTASALTCNGGTITNTGSDSVNVINCVTNNNLAVACVNNVVVANNNNQSATSGSVFTVDNTTVGNVSSGSASNSNTAVVNVGTSCSPVVPAAAPTPQPTNPQGGGQGDGAPVTSNGGGQGGGQVVAPAGAVDAGAGGAAQAANVALPTVGLASSLALLALGLRLRKPAEEL